MRCRHSIYFDTSYFNGTGLNKLCNRVAQAIQKSKVRFSVIAFRGVSGSLVAPLVAVKLRKKIAVVRKRSARSHADRHVEGYLEGNYIIIDDFVESGNTCKAIMRDMDGTCVGIFTYYAYTYTDEEDSVAGVKIFVVKR